VTAIIHCNEWVFFLAQMSIKFVFRDTQFGKNWTRKTKKGPFLNDEIQWECCKHTTENICWCIPINQDGNKMIRAITRQENPSAFGLIFFQKLQFINENLENCIKIQLFISFPKFIFWSLFLLYLETIWIDFCLN
jgi:hypothetical protein